MDVSCNRLADLTVAENVSCFGVVVRYKYMNSKIHGYDGSTTNPKKLCCFLLDPSLVSANVDVCVSFFGESDDDLPKITAEGDIIRLDRFRCSFKPNNAQSTADSSDRSASSAKTKSPTKTVINSSAAGIGEKSTSGSTTRHFELFAWPNVSGRQFVLWSGRDLDTSACPYVEPTKSSRKVRVTAADLIKARKLREWWHTHRDQRDGSTIESLSKAKPYGDIHVAQVIGIWQPVDLGLDNDRVLVRCWDGTKPRKPLITATTDELMSASWYRYDAELSGATSEYSVDVVLYDDWADRAKQLQLKPYDMIQLANVHFYTGKNSESSMLVMHGGTIFNRNLTLVQPETELAARCTTQQDTRTAEYFSRLTEIIGELASRPPSASQRDHMTQGTDIAMANMSYTNDLNVTESENNNDGHNISSSSGNNYGNNNNSHNHDSVHITQSNAQFHIDVQDEYPNDKKLMAVVVDLYCGYVKYQEMECGDIDGGDLLSWAVFSRSVYVLYHWRLELIKTTQNKVPLFREFVTQLFSLNDHIRVIDHVKSMW